MKDVAAAQRYSHALFLAVQEHKGLSFSAVQKQLKQILQMMRSETELKEVLAHALLPLEKKEQALHASAQKQAIHFLPIVKNFIRLLLSKKRLDLLPLIALEFDRAMDQAEGTIKAHIKSAGALDELSKKEIETSLSKILNKKVMLEVAIHPELLAGMIVKAGDMVIDNSLQSRIKHLANVLH